MCFSGGAAILSEEKLVAANADGDLPVDEASSSLAREKQASEDERASEGKRL